MNAENLFTETQRGQARYGKSLVINGHIQWCVTASTEGDRDRAFSCVSTQQDEYDLMTPGTTHHIKLERQELEFDFYKTHE